MQELVFKSRGGKDVTTSMLIAEVFGKSHDKVCRDIKTLSCSPDFNAANFGVIFFHDTMNREQQGYQLTKDGFSFLAMGYTGPKAGAFKEKFIVEFNKREALLKDDDYIVARSQEILTRRLSDAQNKIETLEAKVSIDAPKVLFADTVSASPDSILIKELAAYLTQGGCRIGQNQLFERLRKEGYLCCKGDYYNLPSQKALNLGLFELVKWSGYRKGEFITSTTPKVTGKGQLYFLKKFLKAVQSTEPLSN